MKEGKNFLLVDVLADIKSGLSPSQIAKKYKVSKQNLNYTVGKLKKAGCIKKISYGCWEYVRPYPRSKNLTTRHSTKSTKKLFTSHPKKEIRGHAFIWKIQFFKPFDWGMVVRRYKGKKMHFQLMKHNKVLRTIYGGRKIWLTSKGMIIYEPIDFIGTSSFEVKGRAVFEMDTLIKNFINDLGLKFRHYKFTTSREHYGIMKNELARQYNDKKKKMVIKSEDGDIWMWIDDSLSLGELENNEVKVNRQVQTFWNDHKNHDFQVDASFVLNGFNQQNQSIGKVMQTQEMFAENIKTHVGAIQELGQAVRKLTEKVDQMNSHTK